MTTLTPELFTALSVAGLTAEGAAYAAEARRWADHADSALSLARTAAHNRPETWTDRDGADAAYLLRQAVTDAEAAREYAANAAAALADLNAADTADAARRNVDYLRVYMGDAKWLAERVVGFAERLAA